MRHLKATKRNNFALLLWTISNISILKVKVDLDLTFTVLLANSTDENDDSFLISAPPLPSFSPPPPTPPSPKKKESDSLWKRQFSWNVRSYFLGKYKKNEAFKGN